MGSYTDVTEATFEREVIEVSRQQPVVVDFWAAWCQPCRVIGPVLERLAAEPGAGFKLAKVDVDANQGLSQAFRIQSIPAVKAFVDGAVVDEFVGAIPEPAIREWVGGLLPDPHAGNLEDARRAAGKGRYEEARELLIPLDGEFHADRLRQAIDAVEAEVPEIAEGVPEAGLERLLAVAPKDEHAKDLMLAAFELLGDQEPATREYRRRLANALF
ncbi:MAG: tetratricopeptide repeat protein [Actinobacteria bacterium]|nr:tetratricopeptide repeat protein [Actinomycetota bacterium]